jgi:hypothetical protein
MALLPRTCACCVLPQLYRCRTVSSSLSANIILTAIFHNGEDPLGELDIKDKVRLLLRSTRTFTRRIYRFALPKVPFQNPLLH